MYKIFARVDSFIYARTDINISCSSSKCLWFYRWMHSFYSPHLCSSFSTWIYLNARAPFRDYNKCLHFFCIIRLISRCFSGPLAPGNVRGSQRGSCEVLQRADWSLFACVYVLSLSWKCVLFSSESGYLSCSFDDGLCGWIRDKDGDLHWETTPDPSGNWRAGVVYSCSFWENCLFYCQ